VNHSLFTFLLEICKANAIKKLSSFVLYQKIQGDSRGQVNTLEGDSIGHCE